MKKNLFFRHVFKRQNIIKIFLQNLFLDLASYPRLFIEVFIRKNMGERYFSVASAITVATLLLFLPYIFNRLGGVSELYIPQTDSEFWVKYLTWYALTAAFIYCSYLRWQEVKRNPSVFDFERFSLSSGNIHPLYYKIRLFNVKTNIRVIETYYEPLSVFILGFLFWLIGQSAGLLLMYCAVIYSRSYAAAYRIGDDLVMDNIDMMLMNEEMENAFVDDLPSSETRGVKYFSKKPNSRELRKKVGESFIEDTSDEVSYAV